MRALLLCLCALPALLSGPLSAAHAADLPATLPDLPAGLTAGMSAGPGASLGASPGASLGAAMGDDLGAALGGATRARLLPLIRAEADRLGVPPALADAVASIETGYTETATGSSGEIGLMQVMPSTAWMLGFHGTANDLYEPATNIHYGVTYLAHALAASGGNLCRALMKYRAGTGSEGFSPLSILYCRHAGAVLQKYGSPLAQKVAATTPDAPDLADPYAMAGGGGLRMRPNLAMFAELMGEGGVPVEKPVAAWHISGSRGHPRVQAVMDILRDDNAGADPHVIHIPDSRDAGTDD